MEVTIHAIAAGGDGVGRLDDGIAVFVPRSAPGDVVELEIVERKPRYARGRVVRVQSPGPERVAPRCPHYEGDQCGGCQVQHLSIEAQRRAKQRIVADALRRLGGREVDEPPIAPSPAEWRYRARVTLAANRGRMGYHRRERPGAVFDLEDCHIARRSLMTLWRVVSQHRDHLPPGLVSVSLREDPAGGRHVVVAARDERAWDARPLAAAVDDQAVSFWWKPPRGGARVVAGPKSGFPALTFEQVHPEFGDRIRRDALLALGDVAARVVWDLYAGTGEAAMLLAERGAEVWAVEADRQAVAWGTAEGRRRGLADRLHWRPGLVEHEVPTLPLPDMVLLNPPRTGVSRSVATALEGWAKERPGALASYVSCDPATLARDLRRVPGLRIRALGVYDLFPQTAHVETVVALEAA